MGFADFLNGQTGNLIDWNRPGSLLFSTHRYSAKELAERGAIIAATAICGYLAWNLTESSGYAALGASIGFIVSHAVTMYPLIQKRMQAKLDCNERRLELERQFTDKDPLSQSISRVISLIMEHEASRSPSEIWGKRARLLSTLLEWTRNGYELGKVLESSDIIQLLDKNIHDESATPAPLL